MSSHSAGTAAQILGLSSKTEPIKTHQTAERPLAELTDETLLSLIKTGEKESLGCLFRRYSPSVRSIGQRILHNTAEADDLVQDVFLYVYRKCALYNPLKGSARGWLMQVAYTQAFMRRRKVDSGGFCLSQIRGGNRHSGPNDRNEANMCRKGRDCLSTYRIQQIRWLDLQRTCERYDIQQSDISFTSLDSSNVIPMEMGNFGEPFLRETALKPQFADCCTQRATRIGTSHEFISKPLTTMSLHTISVIILAQVSTISTQCFD